VFVNSNGYDEAVPVYLCRNYERGEEEETAESCTSLMLQRDWWWEHIQVPQSSNMRQSILWLVHYFVLIVDSFSDAGSGSRRSKVNRKRRK
jgi:hypothetical protein